MGLAADPAGAGGRAVWGRDGDVSGELIAAVVVAKAGA